MKTAKDDLKTKTALLLAARKALAKEKRARAKTRREIEALEARLEKLRKKRIASSNREPDRRTASRSRTGEPDEAPATAPDGTADTELLDAAAEEDDADAARRRRSRPPEVVLLDAADGSKVPMLVCADEEEQRWTPGGVGPSAELGFADVATDAHATRFLRPVCDQALPWSASFIGCPGIAHADQGPLKTHDFTRLFRADGTRISGHSKKNRTTPLEVTDALDRAAFRARAAKCPWASANARATLLAARDPAALREILTECAPAKAVRAKRVDGQCGACYAAHVALMAAERRAEKSARGGVDGRAFQTFFRSTQTPVARLIIVTCPSWAHFRKRRVVFLKRCLRFKIVGCAYAHSLARRTLGHARRHALARTSSSICLRSSLPVASRAFRSQSRRDVRHRR